MEKLTRRPRWNPNAIVELTIAGPICSKKNELRFNRNSAKPYYSSETKGNMQAIYEQLDAQWKETIVTDAGPVDTPRPPYANPAIAFVFYVSSRGTRADRDGKLATVLDELVNVGVIRDDSIAAWNGPCLLASAITTDGWAGCRIFIEPRGNLGKLWRYIQNVPDLTSCRLQKSQPTGSRMARA